MGKIAKNELKTGDHAKNLWEHLKKSNRTPVIGTSKLG